MLQMFSDMALKKGWVLFVMVFSMLFEPAEKLSLPAPSAEIEGNGQHSLEAHTGHLHLIEKEDTAKTPTVNFPAANLSMPSSEPPKKQPQEKHKTAAALPETKPEPEMSAVMLQKMKREWMEENKKKPLLHRDLSKLKSVEVTATGYYAGVESTGKRKGHPQYGITYSGVKVRRDVFSTIAADLKVFPLGTILYIPGYGYGIVADIGSKVKGNKIDLYFETKEQVYKEWGKRKVNVYVVKLGNGKITEAMLDNLNGLFLEKARDAKAL